MHAIASANPAVEPAKKQVVITGLVPVIHVDRRAMTLDVDARNKSGHDESLLERQFTSP